MRVLVVDASALGALIFGEPHAEKIADEIQDGRMVAPALLWFELASICLKKAKAHSSQRRQIIEAFGWARHLAIQIVDVDYSAIVATAIKTHITTYDAANLWLARHLRAELVTLDQKMQRLASRSRYESGA